MNYLPTVPWGKLTIRLVSGLESQGWLWEGQRRRGGVRYRRKSNYRVRKCFSGWWLWRVRDYESGDPGVKLKYGGLYILVMFQNQLVINDADKIEPLRIQE